MPESTPTSRPLRLAVIGGGISGLTAAYQLRRLLPQAELRLYDSSDRLGGPLHTLHSGDSILEQGADSFLIKKPWALDLCRELDLADQLVPTSEQHRRALVVWGGRLLPVPDGFVLMRPQNMKAMLRSPLLSPLGKLRLLAEPLVRVPAAAREPGYDESVASFAIRRLGREAYQRLVQPLVAGIFVADAQKLSLAATYPEFLDAEREHGSLWRSVKSGRPAAVDKNRADRPRPAVAAARYGQFVTLRGGLSTLVNRLAKSLPPGVVRLGVEVISITRGEAGRWQLGFGEGAASEPFDGVVLACSAIQSSKLLAAVDDRISRQLAEIEYASSAVVTLAYPRNRISHPLDGFGAVVPAAERRPVIALSFLTVKFPKHAPKDQAVVRVFSGGALQPQLVDQDDRELIATARAQLAELIGAEGEPLETRVARWRRSMPQYQVGHLQLVAAIESGLANLPALQLAGSAYRGVGIPQCIHSGREAAERLARQVANAK